MLTKFQSNLKLTTLASPSHTRSRLGTISMVMMIEPGPKTYHAGLNSEDAEEWKEGIGKE
jgi:hypothetical protein